MEYVLTTNGLNKTYRHFQALNGLSMHVPKGSIYDRLSEPELASGLSYFSGQLVMQDAAPNPLYVAGNRPRLSATGWRQTPTP